MKARTFRLFVFGGLFSFLFYKFCCPSPPEPISIVPEQHLLIFCDPHILQDAEQRSSIRAQLEQKYLSGKKCRPVKVELYAMGCNTIQSKNLLPNCQITKEESGLIAEGSFITEDNVKRRWRTDFDALNANGENGCNQIIASLHLLANQLGGASSDDDVRVIYITAWKEMDISNDFDRQTYRLVSNNPYEGGLYHFEESRLDEMLRQSNNPDSQIRQVAASLKHALSQLNLPNSKKVVYCLKVPPAAPDDSDSRITVRLDSFWNNVFKHADLRRASMGELEDCLR